MKYIGIDLHSDNSFVAVIDEEDNLVYRKRLPNRLEEILAVIRRFGDEVAGIAVESTFNWYWLVDGLMGAGYKLHLVNTAAVKQYEGLKHGDDERDARHLAHLLRLGLLPVGYIYPKERRIWRDLMRKRMQLVQDRSSHIIQVQALVQRHLGGKLCGQTIKTLKHEEMERLGLPDKMNLAAGAHLAVIEVLTEEIECLENEVLGQVREEAAFARLKTVPGIGVILGLTIWLEVGEIGRFASPGNFASYCRCVSSTRISNGKQKGKGNSKNGNRYLAWAFVEAANYAVRYCKEAKAFYQRKKARTNGVVAIKAVAHKLARACYHMMRDDVPFEVERCFA